MVRVAAARCAIGSDLQANIDTLVRCVANAAGGGARLVVLPSFANHPPAYESAVHAWGVAIDVVDPQDAFTCALAEAAAHNQIWVVANSTVRRRAATVRDDARITVTQLLFSPSDGLVGESDGQLPTGAEGAFLAGAGSPGEVVDTPLGRIGMYCCTDGLIPEPARCLAVSGAEILCTGVDPLLRDQASLQIRSRAAENGVWVVASGGFSGAGDPQVVSPDGTLVGVASDAEEALAIAEVDPEVLRRRRRPDGTPLLGLRRPDVYFPIAQDVASLPSTAADTLDAAALQLGAAPGGHHDEPSSVGVDRIVSQVRELAADGLQLIVLPELAGHPAGLVADPVRSAALDADLLQGLAVALEGTSCLVVVSVVSDMDGRAETGFAHLGVVVSATGVLLSQPALHVPERHRSWQVDLGDRVKVLATAFGRLSVLTGDDAVVPESARLAVIGGAEVLGMPFSTTEASDLSVVVPQRCAENRVCVVLGSRSGPAGGAAAFDPPGQESPHGVLDGPERHLAGRSQDHLRATLHPGRTAHKVVGRDIHLLDGRRPELRTALVTPQL